MTMKKLALTAVIVALLLLGSGYYVLSGFSFGGTMVYDLNGPNPPSERTKESWRYRLGQTILPLIYEQDTRYSAGYRDEVFRALTVGTSEGEVRRLLGEPLTTYRLDDGRSVWHYSQRGSKSKNFYVRVLEFDTGDRLLAKGAEFYVD